MVIALAFCPQTIEYQRVLAEAAGYKFDAILCDNGLRRLHALGQAA
jgi:hypothetical protein